MLCSLLLSAVLLAAWSTPDESRVYEFSGSQDLEDFEVLDGKWTVSGGALACTSKGERDEIRWRRRLPGRGVITTELLSSGPTGIRLFGDGHDVRVVVHRSQGTFTIHVDGVRRHQGYFEKSRRGLPLEVRFSAGGIEVVPGDDEAARLEFKDPIPTLASLSLISNRAQARFARLTVERPARDPDVESSRGAEVDPAAESRGLALDDARRLVAEGRHTNALLRLRAAMQTPADQAEDALPSDGVRLLNEILLREPRTRREAPMAGWLAKRHVASRDGTVTATLPLASTWTSESPVARRVDGEILRIRSRSPDLNIVVHRYDQRIQYWFGEEPRTVYVSGSSTTALARARADDMLIERRAAKRITAPRRSRIKLGGQPTTELELSYLESEDGQTGEPVVLREYYANHRGNTHRFTITGDPEAMRVSETALEWILDTFEFHKPQTEPR